MDYGNRASRRCGEKGAECRSVRAPGAARGAGLMRTSPRRRPRRGRARRGRVPVAATAGACARDVLRDSGVPCRPASPRPRRVLRHATAAERQAGVAQRRGQLGQARLDGRARGGGLRAEVDVGLRSPSSAICTDTGPISAGLRCSSASLHAIAREHADLHAEGLRELRRIQRHRQGGHGGRRGVGRRRCADVRRLNAARGGFEAGGQREGLRCRRCELFTGGGSRIGSGVVGAALGLPVVCLPVVGLRYRGLHDIAPRPLGLAAAGMPDGGIRVGGERRLAGLGGADRPPLLARAGLGWSVPQRPASWPARSSRLPVGAGGPASAPEPGPAPRRRFPWPRCRRPRRPRRLRWPASRRASHRPCSHACRAAARRCAAGPRVSRRRVPGWPDSPAWRPRRRLALRRRARRTAAPSAGRIRPRAPRRSRPAAPSPTVSCSGCCESACRAFNQ